MYLTRTQTLLLCLPLAALTLTFHPGVATAESQAPISHVVGGSPVPSGKWRATAGIYFGDSVNGFVGCTGVLIAPTIVMTAGHCVDPNFPIGEVILDTNTIASEFHDQAEIIPAARVVEYPNWPGTYDIAIVELSRPSRVEPMTLSFGCGLDFIADNAPVTIVGYGAIDPGASQFVDEMMEADSIITDHDCSELAHGCRTSVYPDGELGAGGIMGIDSCNGDSGGPLYLRTERGDFLVGLTSRGYADNTVPCSQGGIYVRLDSPTVRDWIESETGVTLPVPTCGLPPVPGTQRFEAESGEGTTIDIAANDPNGDVHTYFTLTDATNGLVEITPDGQVQYTSNLEYEGPDSFTIAVTDDDFPRNTATATVQITVVPAGCCQTGGTPTSSFWLLIAVVFFLRPRSSRRAKGE